MHAQFLPPDHRPAHAVAEVFTQAVQVGNGKERPGSHKVFQPADITGQITVRMPGKIQTGNLVTGRQGKAAATTELSSVTTGTMYNVSFTITFSATPYGWG